MKLFLQLLMSCFAEFHFCMGGGASWKSTVYFFIASFNSLEHSFSVMYTFGPLPLYFSILWVLGKVLRLFSAFLFLLVWIGLYYYHSHT